GVEAFVLTERARWHSHEFGEARAESAQRTETDREAHLCHAQLPYPEKRHRTFDPPCHEVAVRRLAERGTELPAQVTRRDVGVPCQRFDVERLRELPVDSIPHPAQAHEVIQPVRVDGDRNHATMLRGEAADIADVARVVFRYGLDSGRRDLSRKLCDVVEATCSLLAGVDRTGVRALQQGGR